MSPLRRAVRFAVAVTLLVIMYFTIPLTLDLDRSDVVQVLASLLALGLLGFMVIWEVRQQLLHQERTIDRLALTMAVAVLAFAIAFYLMAQRDPGQIDGLHTRVDSLYFTMTTLLTVGYGDIHAEGQTARVLVMVQMVFNVAILATASTTLTHQIRARANESAGTKRQDKDTQRNPT